MMQDFASYLSSILKTFFFLDLELKLQVITLTKKKKVIASLLQSKTIIITLRNNVNSTST